MSVNMVHPLMLTRVALPHFQKRSKKSCIVNISSVMEVFPFPGASLYAGSKAFLHHFSSALETELQHDASMDKPIDVLLVSPGFVSTKLNGMPVIPCLIPTPVSAARSYLSHIGRFKYTNGTIVAKLTLNLLCFTGKYVPGVLNFIFYKREMNTFNKLKS